MWTSPCGIVQILIVWIIFTIYSLCRHKSITLILKYDKVLLWTCPCICTANVLVWTAVKICLCFAAIYLRVISLPDDFVYFPLSFIVWLNKSWTRYFYITHNIQGVSIAISQNINSFESISQTISSAEASWSSFLNDELKPRDDRVSKIHEFIALLDDKRVP